MMMVILVRKEVSVGQQKRKRVLLRHLFDAVSILASAKSDEEERKYTFWVSTCNSKVSCGRKSWTLKEKG